MLGELVPRAKPTFASLRNSVVSLWKPVRSSVRGPSMSIGPVKSTRRERKRKPASKLVSAPSWAKAMFAVLGEATTNSKSWPASASGRRPVSRPSARLWVEVCLR